MNLNKLHSYTTDKFMPLPQYVAYPPSSTQCLFGLLVGGEAE